jgi:uncharacterized protein YfaS (alpha-2-macroglobulin family)
MSNSILRLLICMVCVSTLLIALPTFAQKPMTDDYKTDWQRADSLMVRGLPKSALEIANRAYAGAKKSQNYPQLLKAAMRRVVYSTGAAKDEETFTTLINALRADVANTPAPARNVLQSVLADVYWQYYQANRYRFSNRTATAPDAKLEAADDSADVNTDPRTWDTRRLISTVMDLYKASVREAELLQKTPLAAYDVVLMPGNAEGRILRPTLYDVLAHRAIDFFDNTEADLPRPIQAFELTDPTYLSEAEAFLTKKITTQDTLSGKFQALRLYQELLRFHQNDRDPLAFAVADVARLTFVQTGNVPGERTQLEATLRKQIARYKNTPAEAEYMLPLIRLLAGDDQPARPLYRRGGNVSDNNVPGDPARRNDRREAAAMARDLISRFADSLPAQEARPLLDNLQKPELTLQTEEVNEPGKAFRARVEFRNVKTLYYKLLRLTPDEALTFENHDYQTDPKYDKWFANLLAKKQVAEGQVPLPDDGDLYSHSTEIPLDGLPVGHYALVVSNEGRYAKPSDERAEIVQIGRVVVSNLAYVQPSQYRTTGSSQAYYVTDRQTGLPLAGVNATLLLFSDRSRGNYTRGVAKTTDADGKVVFDNVPTRQSYLIRLAKGDDVLHTEATYAYDRNQYDRPDVPNKHAVIFTDRAIYRPGQTIHYKVLLYAGRDNDFRVLAREKVALRFNDVNGKEVAKTELTTNDFGTAAGTFVAPVGVLTGSMTLELDHDDINYSRSIQVEEYKRPTFAVVAEPLKGSPTLGQTVTVRATAKTLAGAVVDGAQVRYRVTRSYARPWWEWWRPYRVNSNEQEIANGETTTNPDGTVSLTFTATPDSNVPSTDKPRFTYTINIDVTDRSGETRSATQTLRIGYTPLTASLPLPNPLTEAQAQTKLVVGLTNANNVPVSLKTGTVALSRLTAPRNGAALRSRLWAKPDRPTLSREDFEKKFPLDLFADEDNPATWAKTQVRSEPANAVSVAGLAPGLYEAAITATDSVGNSVTETQFFEVIQTGQPTAPNRLGTFVQLLRDVAQPGEEAVFFVGTSQPGAVLMAVEEKGQIVRREWVRVPTGAPVRVALPVQEKHRGGFAVHFAMVQNGRLLNTTKVISVPFSNKQLTIETETFRNKLQPGQAEQWTLRVSGPNQDKVLAEMVASLYDASLDQFTPHDWPTSFYGEGYSTGAYWTSEVFGVAGTRAYWYKPEPHYQQKVIRVLPELGWAGYEYVQYNGRFRLIDGYAYINAILQNDPYIVQGTLKDGIVQGTIRNKDGALPGVSIAWKGSDVGANSDANGKFSLKKPANATTLIIRYVGFTPLEIPIGKKKAFKARFREDVQTLNEVVVVGYGVQKRHYITGAVTTIRGRSSNEAMAMMAAPAPAAARLSSDSEGALQGKAAGVAVQQVENKGNPNVPNVPETAPVIRKNFNETAFFFPQLETDSKGRVVLRFTMPEALTTWRLLTFAHTKTMQTGSLIATAQTQKELMVTTNVPRFFRENDTLRLTARLDNLSDKPLTGTATLELTDALTGEPLTQKMTPKGPGSGVTLSLSQSFTLSKSAVVAWNLVTPTDLPPVAVRVTARAGTFTDGEERVVPVLPNRILVTDTQPFWVDGGAGSKTFRFKALADRNPELPTQTERYTVEVTSNPAWYALQSLPYLMEYQYDCAEQLFSKLYANALGAHILNSRPAFRQVVEQWKQQPPKSPLATNEELKAVVLENTPWLADAKNEAERTAKLGQFFDQNTLAAQQRRAIQKLQQLQDGSGGLTWFSGMRPNFWMSLHVLAGLGHLQKLGVKFDDSVLGEVSTLQSGLLRYADAEAVRLIAEEKRYSATKTSSDSYWAATYLYARSFFLGSDPVQKETQTYLLPSIQKNWQRGNLQSQALAAVTLHRYGLKPDALGILQSLTERSKLSDELGMYWPDNVSGTFWYQAPVETQAYLIEAYQEVTATGTGDPFAWHRKQPAYQKLSGHLFFINKMRQWLIQQKRTQSWASTKATTEAIYALLLTGSDWLDTKNTTTVRVGGQDLASRATRTEALTGYQKVTFAPAEVTPKLGVIEVSKSANTGIAWGAAYWQHFEPMDAVGRSGPGNLNVKKTLFRQRTTDSGPVLEPITAQTALKPGDRLTVRVVLTTDRIMEYVHLKDGRASGFEPVAVLSGSKYQNGLWYYEAPRDASTDFFIEYLPVGTHVFEYNLRVVHAGDFGSGVATVQCFYAPEFAAHSSGGRVQVK